MRLDKRAKARPVFSLESTGPLNSILGLALLCHSVHNDFLRLFLCLSDHSLRVTRSLLLDRLAFHAGFLDGLVGGLLCGDKHAFQHVLGTLGLRQFHFHLLKTMMQRLVLSKNMVEGLGHRVQETVDLFVAVAAEGVVKLFFLYLPWREIQFVDLLVSTGSVEGSFLPGLQGLERKGRRAFRPVEESLCAEREAAVR